MLSVVTSLFTLVTLSRTSTYDSELHVVICKTCVVFYSMVQIQTDHGVKQATETPVNVPLLSVKCVQRRIRWIGWITMYNDEIQDGCDDRYSKTCALT